MTLYDIIFWVLICLIAILAYSIESGLAARHRAVVLSSIASATLVAVYLMFLVDDNSSFDFAPPPKQKEEGGGGGGGGLAGGGGGGGAGAGGAGEAGAAAGAGAAGGDAGAGAAGGDGDGKKTYEDQALLDQPGGFRDCPECPLMIMVPAGNFTMGSPDDEKGRRSNEGPQKSIYISPPFTVSRYEIKKKEFAAFVSETKYEPSKSCEVGGKVSDSYNWRSPGFYQATDEHPVVCITWGDANEYTDWLTKKTQRLYRLLSEPEWEYVARGTATAPFFNGIELLPEHANFANANKGTVETGFAEANKFGLFDVAGNVWEMVEDCWNEDLQKLRDDGSPVRLSGDCGRRALRGGGWESPLEQLRSAYRTSMDVRLASNRIGFRVAREIK